MAEKRALFVFLLASGLVHASAAGWLMYRHESPVLRPGDIRVSLPRSKGGQVHPVAGRPPARRAAPGPLPQPRQNPRPRPRTATARARTPALQRPEAGESLLRNQLLGQLQTVLARHLIYPPVARKRGWEGTVIISLRVTPEGALKDIQLARSSGYDVLDRSALRALGRIPRIDFVGVAAHHTALQLRIPIRYKLTGMVYGTSAFQDLHTHG